MATSWSPWQVLSEAAHGWTWTKLQIYTWVEVSTLDNIAFNQNGWHIHITRLIDNP